MTITTLAPDTLYTMDAVFFDFTAALRPETGGDPAGSAADRIDESARQLVRSLYRAGVKIAVLGAATEAQLLPVLRRAGILELISVIVTTEELPGHPPHVSAAALAARQLGLNESRRVAVFADTLTGVQDAVQEGMNTIAVSGCNPPLAFELTTQLVVPRINLDCLSLKLT
ncbi:HAD hydrolase-like protein [Glutamicibacter sp. PS]|uniref:HAD hydrolase-like protein n=1 Tax=Glutamicibacter sp. PS TaxID=3075634 RepID=UPI002845E682|nr:HAD hydrolase-like protein [Glutamicibacter sp. PS]MDR4534393.1 HAD hydrolase-like protein [Glutamicibacter sp. PS]